LNLLKKELELKKSFCLKKKCSKNLTIKIYIYQSIYMNRAKLFKNGDSQAIRLPKEFRFKGREVYIRREGNNIILTPIDDAVDRLWNSLKSFSEDLIIERNQPKFSDKRNLL
jgi:antitoxin VapB